MTNYELVPVPLPKNKQEAENCERWLETCSAKGGELICFMPTSSTATVLAVFRVSTAGVLKDLKNW